MGEAHTVRREATTCTERSSVMCLIPLLGGVARSAGVGDLSCEAALACLGLAELAALFLGDLACRRQNWPERSSRFLSIFSILNPVANLL